MRTTRRDIAADLALFVDDLELEEEGGCGACGLEAEQMCVACGQCNCDQHVDCARPAADSTPPARVRLVAGITWHCTQPGRRWQTTEPAGYELERRTRSRHGPGDTGWYLFGGNEEAGQVTVSGEFMSRALIYAMTDTASVIGHREG
ncbi:hypothetical protein ACFYOF_20585 [Streptomyces sp. NPDC007148]|uniref:hypothetical protein n=1 Tax=Streptomyces sp. NPDC007148 TaxID=3364775 RepID=UPI00369AA6CF